MDQAQQDSGKLVVITGPSGVGKSTIVREVVDRTGAEFSVSMTTRKPREGEVDWREYHFVDRTTFEEMVSHGEMLEWAEVYGELYGTPTHRVRDAIRAGKIIVLEIDVQGGLQVSKKLPEALFVFIEPPSPEILSQRLTSRGTEDQAAVQRRLSEAANETTAARESGVYNYFVLNDDLEAAVREVVGIINQESPER